MIALILLICVSNSEAQIIGDTLFVATKNPLNLREQASTHSKIESTLNHNSVVELCEIYQLDTIELRISNWYKVKTLKDDVGFVFGGYLNRRKIPTEKFSSITILLNKLINYELMDKIHDYKSNTSGHKETFNSSIYQNNNTYIVSNGGYEWSTTEFYLKNYNLNEMLNLISNFEFMGSNPEYDTLIKSATRNSRKFNYTIAHDDPQREIILEEGQTGELRIQVRE